MRIYNYTTISSAQADLLASPLCILKNQKFKKCLEKHMRKIILL